MFKGTARLLLVLAIALGFGTASAQVVNFSGDDAEMNAAISKAREKLPDFLEKAATLPVQSWFLKAALSSEKPDVAAEHIWMADCARESVDRFTCTLNNAPAHIDLQRGQQVTFGSDIVTDWMYLDPEGRIHGAYTTRVMVSRLPENQVRGLLDQLAPLDED